MRWGLPGSPVAVHWGWQGEIDGLGDKFGIPIGDREKGLRRSACSNSRRLQQGFGGAAAIDSEGPVVAIGGGRMVEELRVEELANPMRRRSASWAREPYAEEVYIVRSAHDFFYLRRGLEGAAEETFRWAGGGRSGLQD
jgi:hypothetical protein